jgi:hypothetical protein
LYREGPSSNSASKNNISPPFAAESSNNNNNNINPAPSFNTSQSTPAKDCKCDQSLWNHDYNPTRLQVVAPCKSVVGVIESKRVEKDGDYHIRVKLDPPFSNLINSANMKNQFGDLVVGTNLCKQSNSSRCYFSLSKLSPKYWYPTNR